METIVKTYHLTMEVSNISIDLGYFKNMTKLNLFVRQLQNNNKDKILKFHFTDSNNLSTDERIY